MPTKLIDEHTIQSRVDSLAHEIAQVFPQDLTLVVILKGGFVFGADLLRALGRIGLSPRVEFLQLRSYRGGRHSGDLEILLSPPQSSLGPVLIVDDIADTGRSLQAARDLLSPIADQVKVCVLVDKPSGREVECAPDFVGFVVEEAFLVGYGLDDAERDRHLSWIGVVD